MTSLTKHTIGLVLIGLTLFGGCKSSETAPTDQVMLGVNKSSRVGADITVRVDTIQDSRCPQGVNCIWQGQAFVSALISTTDTQQRVQLYTNPFPGTNQPSSVAVALSGTAYKVTLSGAYSNDPNSAHPAQQAIIQVTKL